MRFEVRAVYAGQLDTELDKKLVVAAGRHPTFASVDLRAMEREQSWTFDKWPEAMSVKYKLEEADPRVTVHCDPPAH